MKFVNKTHWNTRDLRRIAQRVCREEFPRDRFGAKWRQMRVVVGYNRAGDGSSSGHAYYGGSTAYVNVPSGNVRGKGAVGHVDPIDFAHVVAHEFGHCKGLRHGRMPPHMDGTKAGKRSDYITQHFAWAAAIPIRRQVPVRAARPTADDKLAHAERMLRRAQTRLKRAQTIERKWRRSVAYYTKQTNAGLAQAAQGVAG